MRKSGFSRYLAFAKTIERLLRQAIEQSGRLANLPQSQSRAKSPESLQRKIAERGSGSETVEEFKDLAGCRLIFYTDTDLERFRGSSILHDNFDIDWSASKTHFPQDEKASVDELYQGIHIVISLKKDRANLLEYAEFKGLRCEVQLQTILNHAWSETAHDVIYKPKIVEGFGTRQLEDLKDGFARVMREHLIPAGYEFQKIQSSAERLAQGLELFDEKPLRRLAAAKDNNERLVLLEEIREYFISGVDKLEGYVEEIRVGVISAVEAARTTAVVSRKGILGGFPGASALDVLNVGLEILNHLRYWNAEKGFASLIQLWRGAKGPDERKAIEASVERVAKYFIPIWEKVGAGLQLALLDELENLSEDARKEIRPIVLLVCREALDSDMEYSEATSFDTITFHRGKVNAHQSLLEARAKAEKLSLEAFHDSRTPAGLFACWATLWHGTTGAVASAGDLNLRKVQIELMNRICLEIAKEGVRLPFDVLQKIEEDLYWAYRRFCIHCNDDKNPVELLVSQSKDALKTCRDWLNQNEDFVRYKTLVGFRTVYPDEWDDDRDYDRKEKMRQERIENYLRSISSETLPEWIDLVKKCAETESDDLATFPPLSNFFRRLSEEKPELGLKLFLDGGRSLERFAPSFFPQLLRSHIRAQSKDVLANWLKDGRDPGALGRVLFVCEVAFVSIIHDAERYALARDEKGLAWELAHAALKHGKTSKELWTGTFVKMVELLTRAQLGTIASSHLIAKEDETLIEELPEPAIKALVDNFTVCREIGYIEQGRLAKIAARYPDWVWDVFFKRLQLAAGKSMTDRFEAVPWDWHDRGLEMAMASNVETAFDRMKAWPEGDGIYPWRKAKLLARLFRKCDQSFIDGMTKIVYRDGVSEFGFIREILSHFDGNPSLDPICQAMVIAANNDQDALSQVQRIIVTTGVVHGEFGFAEAYETKAKRLAGWLEHPNSEVRDFARSTIDILQKMALDDRRRATQRRELRKRDFENDDE